ncbi:MAG: hemin uptake protein HemP [Burkholderiales bacterium]
MDPLAPTSKPATVTDAVVDPAHKALTARTPREITSEQLLQGDRELVIRHTGRAYRLCLTSRNKLILVA